MSIYPVFIYIDNWGDTYCLIIYKYIMKVWAYHIF